jgi:hypothetical protein
VSECDRFIGRPLIVITGVVQRLDEFQKINFKAVLVSCRSVCNDALLLDRF